MAWISVHDHVNGPKLRRLSKALNCSKAEALGILNFLWFWGLNNADENGRIEDADKDDIAEALSGITRISSDTIVTALFVTGWLDDVDGHAYLHDWADWQEQWYKFCRKKDYDARRKRDERSKTRKTGLPEQEEPPRPEDPPVSPPGDAGEAPRTPDDTPPAEPVSKKRKKPERNTVKMADFVHLTEKEYQKLCEEYGERAAKQMIVELDLYKGSKGKAYKDDYRAILSWVVDRVDKKYPGMIVKKSAHEGENPFKKYDRGDT